MTDIHTYAADPVAFVADLFAGTGRTLTGYQRELVESLAPSLLALQRREVASLRRWWVEQTKGAGKDTVLAAAALWLVAFCRWAMFGQVGAVDQGQADELRKAVLDFVRSHEWLSQLVTVQSSRIVNGRTEAAVEIIPADAPGSHGARPDFLIINEICHHQSEEFASNLMDNAAKVDRSLAVVATNAGSVVHWSWKWRELARESDRWSFHQHAEPAPWIGPDELAEAEKRNPPSRFKRLFHGVWSSGSGDALSGEWIDRALVLHGPSASSPGPHWRCVAGLDCGTRKDFSALCVLAKHMGGYEREYGGEPRRVTHMERLLMEVGELPSRPEFNESQQELYDRLTGRAKPTGDFKTIQPTGEIRLLHVRVWKPAGHEVDLSAIENEVLRCKQAFGLARVCFDPWQLTGSGQRLRRKGVNMQPVDPTGGNLTSMARELMRVFSDDRVRLYPDEYLERDLRAMSLVERSYGYRIESPRTREAGHADAGTAFCLALLAAAQLRRAVPRPLTWLGSPVEEAAAR